MTKRPFLLIEQVADIEQDHWLFDRLDRQVSRLKKIINNQIDNPEIKTILSLLAESIKDSNQDQRDRDQLKTEIINKLLKANSAL